MSHPAISQKSTRPRPRVVILGGGFAGLNAARSLRRTDVDVVLFDRRNFHLFQPLLYQVATGDLSPANIASPLRAILRKQKNVKVLLGEVTGLDTEKSVVLHSDGELEFDYLIVATGTTHHYFGNEQWGKYATGLKTLENATKIRRQILGAFEAAERATDQSEIDELLTFVIVGAGPTGCELAGALSDVAFNTIEHDFRTIDPKQARIKIIETDELPLDFFAEPLPQRAKSDLQRLGVEVISNARVTDVTPTHVLVHNSVSGETTEIRSRTIIWGAGVKAVAVAAEVCSACGVEQGAGGRIPVNEDLSVGDHANIFACGDTAHFVHCPAGQLPGLAPVAMQMGKHAAACIKDDLRGKNRKGFTYYDKGSLAVIGRFSAVGEIGSYKAKGFIAWFLWLAVHLMYITMFRNRMLVLIQWGWTFLTHDRSARLIIDGPSSRIPTMGESTGWDEDPAMPSIGDQRPAES